MLGSEYNWLVSLLRTPNGLPRVRIAGGNLITLAIAVFCFLAITLHAAPADQGAWSLPETDGIIEGMAIHSATGEAFFGDVRNRCIWFRDVSAGTPVLRKFSTDTDGLLGVFALKIDATGRTLWASSSAVPEMKGGSPADRERGLLAAYDLPTRTLRRTYPLPADGRRHVLGDFILRADGTVFATDSLAPVIWRLAPGGDKLENWLERPDFKNLQGLALTADGRALVVADYPQGLWHINLTTRNATLLPMPAGANFRGLDGLYGVPGGIVAVQNGLSPQRILRIDLDDAGQPTGWKVLLAGDPAMTDLSLGQVVTGRLHFIANSGWELYAHPGAAPAARTVTILSTSTD